MLTIAVGDIHGASDKLDDLLRQVDQWLVNHREDRPTQFIFLGDYVDRGPDAKGVIERVRRLQDAGAICLMGNHEAMMIEASDDPEKRQQFYKNGGLQTLASLDTTDAFAEAVKWMRSLPTSFEDDLRYFVHAGIRPNIPLSDQVVDDQLWIREPFLSFQGQFPKYVVHGHTPIKPSSSGHRVPEILPNRSNVDTGAAWGGPVSAVVFDDKYTQPICWIAGTIRSGPKNAP